MTSPAPNYASDDEVSLEVIGRRTRSTIEGRRCDIFFPVLGGDGTKIVLIGDIFDQPSGGMSSIWGKLTDHVEDHVVLSPEGAVLVTSPGTKSSYPRPPQPLNNLEIACRSSSLRVRGKNSGRERESQVLLKFVAECFAIMHACRVGQACC